MTDFVTFSTYLAEGKIDEFCAARPSVYLVNDKKETLLHQAAFRGCVEAMEYLLLNGANIEARCSSGYTPLMETARGAKVEAGKYLLAHGADINARNSAGRDLAGVAEHHKSNGFMTALQAGANQWRKVGGDEVSRSRSAYGYAMTEIFNFRACTYTVIARNVSSGQESLAVKSFGEIAEGSLVQEAESAFIEKRGTFPQGYRQRNLVKRPRLGD